MDTSVFLKDIESLLHHTIEPSLFLYGPHESKILLFIHNYLKNIHGPLIHDAVMVLHLSTATTADITALCDKIINFNGLQSLLDIQLKKGYKKILIIKQNCEKMADILIHILEEVLFENKIRIIIISTSFHELSSLLKPRLLIIMIPPEKTEDNKFNNHILFLHDQSCVEEVDLTTSTDEEVYNKIFALSNLMEYSPSPEYLELYYNLEI